MPTFRELQSALQAARTDRANADAATLLSAERLTLIGREHERLLRTEGPQSESLEALRELTTSHERRLAAAHARLEAAAAEHDRLVHDFEPFTDPRRHLNRLSDDFPILLFPVRLETRFRTVERHGGGLKHQLWVRIFPDDCSVDSFDETLSEAELKKARNYWTNRWKTGTAANESLKQLVLDEDRGTWRELMGTINSGRAHWIREHYVPVNAAEMPVRNHQDEKILVIPTEDLPDQSTQNALRTYWAAVHHAGADAGQAAAALAALVATLGIGEEQTRALVERYTPDNFAARVDNGGSPPPVQVVFMVLPSTDDIGTTLAAWSRAARVTTLPDRFVLLGFQSDRTTPVINELGSLIPNPLIVGPDPALDIDAVLKSIHGAGFDTFTDDEKAERYVDYLAGQSETKWLFDFDEAVRVGMGFKVDITAETRRRGVDRLFAIGISLSASETDAQSALEELLTHHHYGDSGLSILPQGTPTNNTEDSQSGYSDSEDPDEAYDNYHRGAPPEDPTDASLKRDGRWLAELLGVSVERSSLDLVPGYYLKDQSEARAMNTALWSATLGYFMESMLTPVFTEWQRHFTRWFLINHVSGRGRLPAIRIGDQPYGILPATTFTSMPWLEQDDSRVPRTLRPYRQALQALHSVLNRMREDWVDKLGSVAYIGRQGDVDAHQLLLQALGLHANSVEFDQRYAESFEHQFNWLVALGFDDFVQLLERRYRERGLELLSDVGYVHDPRVDPAIPILDRFFFTKEHDVVKPLIDDRELSEKKAIRPYTDLEQNYIEWLIENARNDHRNIRDQKGFSGNQPPYALLYDMLRHALNLQFAGTALNLYRAAEILDEAQANVLRVDAEFIGVRAQPMGLESKWDLIYRPDDRIAENGALLVDHISDLLKGNVVNSQTNNLNELIEALDLLKDAPTARLERAFVEHLDLCTYRLDAWMLGLVDAQLHEMRDLRTASETGPREGIYLGAFGWLEHVKADERTLEPATLSTDMRKIFDPDGAIHPMVDDTNAGYVHAPSINHAITAAVLRNAYISNASKEAAEPYKVNLSSERVRAALAIIEGMQQGQSLGALLGYRLERGLHDNTAHELDIYIYELRKVFPLVSNRLRQTQIQHAKPAATPADAQRNQEEEEELSAAAAVTKIEARNVVDGVSLLDHIRKTKQETYPFGFVIGDGPDRLRAPEPGHAAAINAEVRRLMSIRDAVADLAMAESVHQVVQGNYDRAAGALDAYSKGNYPQMPDVIRSAHSGVSLTHRFGIHLPTGITPAATDTPRARTEPAVNSWIRDLLPADLSRVACLVEYTIPSYDGAVPDPVVTKRVSLDDLGLLPIDLLYMVNVETDKSLTALDDHVLEFVFRDDTLRADVEIAIRYAHTFDPADDILSFFEVMPLIHNLRALVISSRALLPADLAVPNDGRRSQNASAVIDATRVAAARQDVLDLVDDLESDVVDPLDLLIDDEDFDATLGNQAALIAQADSRIDDFITHLSALSRFGIPQAGFGFVYARRRAIHSAARQKVAAYRSRWRDRQGQYETLLTVDFPAATTDDERYEILERAERLISTVVSVPSPAIVTYLTTLAQKKSDFDLALSGLHSFIATDFPSMKDLLDGIGTLATTLGAFDPLPLEAREDERQVVVLLEDIFTQARGMIATLRKEMGEVQTLIADAAAMANPADRLGLLADAVKRIFGAEFQIVPEFTLSNEQGSELQQSFADRAQLLDYQMNVKASDFPVDDWLYGIARVREKVAAWESLVMLAEGFRERPPLDLTPLQLPYVANDHWLALAYPTDFEIASDKLLYTAYMQGFAPLGPQCGLLVDEWTEVIPSKKETTGLTFHFDRPNSEPPQTFLLVTPPAFTGAWEWSDVVRAMHETLDLAQMRAIEPDHVDETRYAQFLPATVAATTARPVTMAINFALAADQIVRNGGDGNA
ncbi:MAG: hypothetical protein M3406_14565 [Chloroflexota bacterium]|nr:hypothetical protein [Chloroflexota bacterium]